MEWNTVLNNGGDVATQKPLESAIVTILPIMAPKNPFDTLSGSSNILLEFVEDTPKN